MDFKSVFAMTATFITRIIKESILLLIFTSYFQFFFQLIAKRTDKQPIAVNLHQQVRLKNYQRRLILYESDTIIINNISCTPLIVLDCYRFSWSDKLFRTGQCRIQSCHFLQSYGFQPFTERNRGNHCKGMLI